jgi:hypothetical protein
MEEKILEKIGYGENSFVWLEGRKKYCCEDKKDLNFPPCVFDTEYEKYKFLLFG